MVFISFGSTEVKKGSAFLPEKAEQQNEELNIQDVNSHPTSLFPTCYPPRFLHVLVLVRPQRPVEICIKVLQPDSISQICYFNELMKMFIGNNHVHIVKLCYDCYGQTLVICVKWRFVDNSANINSAFSVAQ